MVIYLLKKAACGISCLYEHIRRHIHKHSEVHRHHKITHTVEERDSCETELVILFTGCFMQVLTLLGDNLSKQQRSHTFSSVYYFLDQGKQKTIFLKGTYSKVRIVLYNKKNPHLTSETNVSRSQFWRNKQNKILSLYL